MISVGRLARKFGLSRTTLLYYDRIGLLRDITNVVSAEHVNIHSMSSQEHHDSNSCTVTLTVYTNGVDQLSRLFSRLEAIPGIHSVVRISDTGTPPSGETYAATRG